MPQNIDDIENRDLLVRLDERTDSIKKDLTNIRSDIVDLKNETKQRLDKQDDKFKSYITREEFAPIQRALYAIASLIIMSVVGTLLSFVLKR